MKKLSEWKIVRNTESALISKNPVLISSIIANPTGTALGRLLLYNDYRSEFYPLISITCGSNMMANVIYPFPVLFNRGLYVAKVSNIYDYTIHYMPYLSNDDVLD